MTSTSAPTIERQSKKSRRVAAIAATGTLALAVIAGGTYAAWTDAEWAQGSYDIGTDTKYNLQILSSATDLDDNLANSVSGETWLETSQTTSNPDGAFETSVQVTGKALLPASTNLYPGWEGTRYIYIRNNSSYASTLTVQAVVDSTNTAVQFINQNQDYLEFDLGISIGTVSANKVTSFETTNAHTAYTNLGFNTLKNTPQLLTKDASTYIPAGAIVRIELKVKFDPTGALNSDVNSAAISIASDGALVMNLKFAGSSVIPS
jgi:predicted ribosomally synthesized peptide with SipW-like signal peptide